MTRRACIMYRQEDRHIVKRPWGSQRDTKVFSMATLKLVLLNIYWISV